MKYGVTGPPFTKRHAQHKIQRYKMMLQVPQTYPVRAYKKPLGFSKVMLKTDALTTKTSPSHFVVSTSFWSKDPLCSSTELNHFFQSQPSDPQVPFCRQVSVPSWAKSILIYVLRSRFLPWAMLTKLHCLHILFFSKTVKGEDKGTHKQKMQQKHRKEILKSGTVSRKFQVWNSAIQSCAVWMFRGIWTRSQCIL